MTGSARRPVSRLTLFFAVAALCADQASKTWARQALTAATPHAFLPGLLRFNLTSNAGGAFGIGREAGWLMGTLAACLTLAIVLWIRARERSASAPDSLERAGMGLIIGGALGNLWDRLADGQVTDFIEFDFVTFPVFNLADACIDAGIALIALSYLRAAGRCRGLSRTAVPSGKEDSWK